MAEARTADGETPGPWLLVVGAASRDVDASDPRGWRLGGTVTYAAMVAARLCVRVRALVGVDGEAARSHELEALRDAGVELALVRLDRGPVFENRQTDHGRVQLVQGGSDRLAPGALPSGWAEAPAVLLGPVAGEIGEDWADAPRHDALVALGWQGLVRRLHPGSPVERLPLRPNRLAERADVAVASAEDAARGGAPLTDLLARPGQELALTHGARGALHVRRHGEARPRLSMRRLPAIPSRSGAHPTGAGDVFLAAWVVARLVSPPDTPPWRSLAVASAAASLTVDARTLTDLPDASSIWRRLVRPPGARRPVA